MADRFRLDQFRATAINSGLAMSNQFHCLIHQNELRGSEQGFGGTEILVESRRQNPVTRKIPFFAHQAEIPGFNAELTRARRYGTGPAYVYPISNSAGEMTVSFYVDQEGTILQYFQDWAQKVVNFKLDIVNPEYEQENFYTVGYKSEYARTMQILLFQRGLNTYAEFELANIFPIQIGSPSLDWGAHDIIRLPIRFAYDNYKMERKTNDALTLKNIISNPKQVLEGVISSVPAAGYVLGELQGLNDIYNQVKSSVNIVRSTI